MMTEVTLSRFLYILWGAEW